MGWIAAQVIAGIAVGVAALNKGFWTTNDFVDITRIGMVAAIAYASYLGVGLYKLYNKKFIDAARSIRNATIFAILLMYPFIFFRYPIIGTIGMLITIPVTIGLSKVSVNDLMRNLYIH